MKREENGMMMTRREFIVRSLIMGGTLLFLPLRAHTQPQNKTGQWTPAYARLENEGQLAKRIKQA